jgi:hypothetical protein
VRCLVKFEYGENIGISLRYSSVSRRVFLKLNSKQNQADLHPLGVPAGAVRRSGYLWVGNVLFG